MHAERAVMLPRVDVDQVAARAARAQPPRTPDDVIRRELDRLGVPGDYMSSRTRRRLHDACAQAWRRLVYPRNGQPRGPLPRRPRRRCGQGSPNYGRIKALTPGDFWGAHDRGLTLREWARSMTMDPERVRERGRELGFRRMSGNGRVILEGPCAACGRVYDVADLDARTHRCERCG